jgi:hypothetical protein
MLQQQRQVQWQAQRQVGLLDRQQQLLLVSTL